MPLDEYKANLAAMVAAARKAGVPHILLVTPPPVDEAAWAKAVSGWLKSAALAANAAVAQSTFERGCGGARMHYFAAASAAWGLA